MACCGKNNNCAKDNKMFETTEAPVESLLDFGNIVGLLSTMAATGVKNFAFKDATLDKLAETVASLAAENNYLKKLVAVWSPTAVELSGDTITITFGPGNVYSLTLPTGNATQKKHLARQFQQLAKSLGAPAENIQQLQLF